MLRVAAVLLADRALAEDVVQDAYVSVYGALGAAARPGRGRRLPAPQRRQRRPVAAAPPGGGAAARARRRPRTRPAPRTTRSPALADAPLVRALRALPRREREVVLLRHYLDLSERQTADALGLRPGSVKAYGSRGLATLRAGLSTLEGQGR